MAATPVGPCRRSADDGTVMTMTWSMPWLGPKRGYLSDWTTQRWVQLTGRRVDFTRYPWLYGPIGRPSGIGKRFFEDHAADAGLEILRDKGKRGLIPDFRVLDGPTFDSSHVDPDVVHFYERTSSYEIDAWVEWQGAFRPFGSLLVSIF